MIVTQLKTTEFRRPNKADFSYVITFNIPQQFLSQIQHTSREHAASQPANRKSSARIKRSLIARSYVTSLAV